MDPCEAFEAFRATLIGEPISKIWRGYGSAVFLEIGDLSPTRRKDGTPGPPDGEVSLGVEWNWRIEDDRSIICGSWSDEELWEPTFELLRNKRIAQVSLFGSLPEVVITTVDGMRFITFSTTDGQPQWHLVDRRHGPARWFIVRNGQLDLGDGTEVAC